MEHETVQGVAIPKLGYGTWRLTGRDCRQGVADALAIGYRHIDTAQAYGNEDEVGEAIAASGVPREEIFLTTKLASSELSAARVRETTRESLARLGTDYVDLLLIHWPNPQVPLAETLDAMSELRERELVGGIGLSNFPPSLVSRAVARTPILANQVEYHPYLSQNALLALAREHDHLLTAYAPLARATVFDDPVIVEIAAGHGATPGQVALAWLLAQDHVAAIPKATARERIEENFGAVGLRLSDEERQRITVLDKGSAGRLVNPGHAPDWERDD